MIIEEYRGPLHGVVLWITDSGEYAVHAFNIEEAVSLGWSSGLSSGDYFGPDRRKDAHDRWAERVEALRSHLDGDLLDLADERDSRTKDAPGGVETTHAPDILDLIGETQASMRGDS
jgi:hypothetical protein